MRFLRTALAGVVVVEAEPHRDERGFFARIYDPRAFAEAGLSFTPTQVNLSRNTVRHTLRGLHYQAEPHAEAKLVRVTRGSAFDVIVDLREGSASFRRWLCVELDAQSARAVFIPEGCAHGFLTLEPETDMLYQMGRDFVPGHAAGLRWDDPALAIAWPADPAVISPADASWPFLQP
jgi:dTDP-4-dehydrorhamnose 3,5-epimerase